MFQDGVLVGIDGLMVDKTIAMMKSMKGAGDQGVGAGAFSPNATFCGDQPVQRPAPEARHVQIKRGRQARGNSEINI